MRKSLLILSAVFFATTVHAQLHSRSTSYAGLKLGGSAATITGDVPANMRYVYGLSGGLFVHLPLSRPFSVQPELLYSMKGYRSPASYPDASTWLNYIDVPVAFRAATSAGLFVEAGPQLGILLTAKSDATGEKANVKSLYRPVDFGFVLGAGYQPRKGGLGIGGRYNASFNTVLKDGADGTVAGNAQNSAFQVFLTYSRPTYHKSTKRKDK
jgi:hypothetical protein